MSGTSLASTRPVTCTISLYLTTSHLASVLVYPITSHRVGWDGLRTDEIGLGEQGNS